MNTDISRAISIVLSLAIIFAVLATAAQIVHGLTR